MSIHKLPPHFKADQFCKSAPLEGILFEGEFPIEKLLGLNPELRKQGRSPIRYSLRFYVDGEGISVVEGEMAGEFELICQRCMQPMSYTLKANPKVSPVASDVQAGQLPAQYEPLLMEHGEVNFAEWIAEELHLALPLVARHDSACVSHDSYIQDNTGE